MEMLHFGRKCNYCSSDAALRLRARRSQQVQPSSPYRCLRFCGFMASHYAPADVWQWPNIHFPFTRRGRVLHGRWMIICQACSKIWWTILPTRMAQHPSPWLLHVPSFTPFYLATARSLLPSNLTRRECCSISQAPEPALQMRNSTRPTIYDTSFRPASARCRGSLTHPDLSSALALSVDGPSSYTSSTQRSFSMAFTAVTLPKL